MVSVTTFESSSRRNRPLLPGCNMLYKNSRRIRVGLGRTGHHCDNTGGIQMDAEKGADTSL